MKTPPLLRKNTFLARFLQILQDPCKILQDNALFLRDLIRFLQKMYSL